MTLTFRETINIQLTQPQWIELDPSVKTQLINIFSIPRSEPTRIDQGLIPGKGLGTIIHSDGHSHKDLAVITVKKMQEYLGNYERTDFYSLFDQVLNRLAVDKVNHVEVEAKMVEKENIAKWLMVLKDMRDKAKEYNLVEQLSVLVNEIFPNEIQTVPTKTIKRGKAGK